MIKIKESSSGDSTRIMVVCDNCGKEGRIKQIDLHCYDPACCGEQVQLKLNVYTTHIDLDADTEEGLCEKCFTKKEDTERREKRMLERRAIRAHMDGGAGK